MPDITEVTFVDRETILKSLLEHVAESSTWVSECCGLSDADRENAVLCLAEISGAVRLVKKLLKLDEIDFHIRTFEDDEEKRS